MRRRGVLLIVVVFLGCRAALGIHDPEIEGEPLESGTNDRAIGDETEPGDGGSDAIDDTFFADAVPPTTMITVPLPVGLGGSSFQIDAHEVTQAQYADFLARGPKPTPANQVTFCDANTSFAPARNFTPTGTPNLPVTTVDWCDAVAYCSWVGKTLCGGIKTDAGAYTDLFDPNKNEWLFACTKGGGQSYSYGTTEQPVACNVIDAGINKVVDAGEKAQCEGAYPGLFDMIGNVTEWSAMCEPNDAGLCGIMGGSYSFPAVASVQCSTFTATQRNGAFDDLGFRCCSLP